MGGTDVYLVTIQHPLANIPMNLLNGMDTTMILVILELSYQVSKEDYLKELRQK